MKNLILSGVLIILIVCAYLLNKKNNPYVFAEMTEVSLIRAEGYELKKLEGKWLLGSKEVEAGFMGIILNILESLKIQSKASIQVTPDSKKNTLSLLLDNREVILRLGDKAFADSGLYLQIDSKWFRVKNEYSKDVLYKDSNDLAQKQYQMLQNLFYFSREQIKLK